MTIGNGAQLLNIIVDGRKLLLLNCYKPPSIDSLKYMDPWTTYNMLVRKGVDFIMGGDFNQPMESTV
jgi:hypothetical protein